MPWYIKNEKFKKSSTKLSHVYRKTVIHKHQAWVESLSKKGIKIQSGYLVDEKKIPGGGGLLILEANSFQSAKELVEQDPMILEQLVEWELQEWINVGGNLIT